LRFFTIVSVVTLVWEYLPGSLQDKILSDGCLEKEQMVVSAIASTPQPCKQGCVHLENVEAKF
ncbi:hypothetical protein ACSRNT_004668, partial [Escherichia coli]